MPTDVVLLGSDHNTRTQVAAFLGLHGCVVHLDPARAPAGSALLALDAAYDAFRMSPSARRRFLVLNAGFQGWRSVRSALALAGLDVPRFADAVKPGEWHRHARSIGLPVLVRTRDGRVVLRAQSVADLDRMLDDVPHLLDVEEDLDRAVASRSLYAVGGGRADLIVGQEDPGDLDTPRRVAALTQACGLDFGEFEVARTDGRSIVTRVEPAGRWDEQRLAAVVRAIRDGVAGARPLVRSRAPVRRTSLHVGVGCPDPRVRRPVWLWLPIVEALERRGARVEVVDLPTAAASRFDYLHVDPRRTFRRAGRDPALQDALYDAHRHHGHYVQRTHLGRLVSVTTKRAVHGMVRELNMPHPSTYTGAIPESAAWPVIAKRSRGFGGHGTRLFHSQGEFVSRFGRLDVPRGWVVQEFVRPATGHPASVRVVTVRGRVIAAAVFYAADGFVSNAGAGGRILPLTGRNRDCRLGPMERRVLEALGIDATSRELPVDAQDAVTRASDWLGARGVQICGHDLLRASDGGWLYIESNAFPGYRVFSATDGDGSRDLLKSYRLAGEILADAIAAAFES